MRLLFSFSLTCHAALCGRAAAYSAATTDSALQRFRGTFGLPWHPALRVTSSPSVGCGVTTAADLADGEVLIDLPWAACLSVPAALRDPLVGEDLAAFQAKAGPGSELVVLAGALAMAKLRSDEGVEGGGGTKGGANKGGPASGFEDYAASLDFDDDSHVSRWDPARLAAFLGDDELDPALAAEAAALLAVADAAAKGLGPLLSTNDPYGWFRMGRAGVDYEGLARKAFAAVLTRVFDPPPVAPPVATTPGGGGGGGEPQERTWGDGGGDGPAMLPLIDLLNHAPFGSALCNTRYVAGSAGDPFAVRLLTRGAVPAHTELRQDYGHSMQTLLLTHGFFDDNEAM